MSLSSIMDGWNKCGCEAAMAGDKIHSSGKISTSAKAEIARRKKRYGDSERNV
jgi:hypothetical protein